MNKFSTELIRNLGFSTIKTTLMDCIGNAFQVFGLISGGYFASHIKNSEQPQQHYLAFTFLISFYTA